MLNAAGQVPSTRGKRQIRRLPKTGPVLSKFTVSPKGLPIDFYDCQWYCNLSNAQQKIIPNLEAVAFLPDAKQSLAPKQQRHPDQKLTDSSFTCKYWDLLVEPYGLLDGSSSSDGDDEDDTHDKPNNDDSEGEGHDLYATSPDCSEDEYLEEGDAGSQYDDDGFVTGDNKSKDGDYTDKGDEAEEDSPSGSKRDDLLDHNVSMEENNVGIDPNLLAIMEQEEEVW
ncbi:hypothetical protein VP01_4821g1 [Puccinia sorghi]|uniref:Transcription factor Iwr1 domain-containing protein n=1 Tax=Puccinia sorghi TaxID=27349 RepID=A0A0L6UPG6_9BASI|nr:hypothetical protein VP01_4821g1 [Puccinia sorghi]